MTVTIKYSAQLKRAAGLASEEVNVGAGASLQKTILDLATKKGEPFKGLLLNAGGALHAHILLCVGDEQVEWDTPRQLKDGDAITLLSPIAGG